MQRTRKRNRLLSFLLALVLVLGLLPMGALAAGDITVYVSVVQEGAFITGENDTVMACAPVTVAAESPTIHDAFTVLHNEYYGGGSDGYAIGSGENPLVTKFWGIESVAIGYCNNNEYALGTADPVADGAHLVFWFYQDAASWSDTYTYFNRTSADISGGEALELTLTAAGYSGAAPLAGAAITVNGVTTDRTTGADGKVTLYFAKAGNYVVSATPADGCIVPPVCKVTVTGDDNNAEATIASDKESLTLPEQTTTDLTLPAVGASGKTAVTWASSDASVISNTGAVTRGSAAGSATLTATLCYGDMKDTKAFTVWVPAMTDAELLSAAKAALEAENAFDLRQWNEAGTGGQDTNIVTVAQAVVDAAVTGVTVEANVVSDTASTIGTDGTIVYPSRAKSVQVTFTLCKSGESETAMASIAVPASAYSRQKLMDSVTKALIEAYILGENTSWDSVTSDLALPASLSNIEGVDMIAGYMIDVAWNSGECGNISRYGDVTRPVYGAQDVRFTLMCTLSYSAAMEPYMGHFAGATPQDVVYSFPLTIKAVSETEYNAAKSAVDGALNSFDTGSITLFANMEAAADLTEVTENLFLPDDRTMDDAAWTSSDENVIAAPSYGTGKATVTRPAVGAGDATVTLTLTLTKNGYSNSKEIPVTVKAMTQAEVNAEQAYLNAVKAALTFDVIKKDNLLASEVTGSMQMVYRGYYTAETGDVTWGTSNRGDDGISITWASSDETVVKTYGTVSRPAVATQVTLTATLHSQQLSAHVPDQTVEIHLTVLASGQDSTLITAMRNIAAVYAGKEAAWWGTSAAKGGPDWWQAVAMAAYADYSGTSLLSAEQKQALANQLIAQAAENISSTGSQVPGEAAAANALANAINGLSALGFDPQQITTINSTRIAAGNALGKTNVTAAQQGWFLTIAPYVLVALHQDGYGDAGLENALVDYLLDQQESGGGWSTTWGIDSTAMVVQGLALSDRDDAKAACNKAISVMAEKFSAASGTSYGNANSDAMAIIALAAMGIDPSVDSRFVKNGVALTDGLLGYLNSEKNGFGNEYATKQAFLALVAAAQIRQSNEAVQVLDFSNITKQPVSATTAGGAVAPADPTGDEITVTMTIKSDTGYWMHEKPVTIPGTGATVYHAFVRALQGSGIVQAGASDGYVRSMTYNGRELAEFTNGPDSGWLYKVNGVLPDVGLTTCSIAEGDHIVWYYTDDWTQDPSADIFGPSADQKAADAVVRLIQAIGVVTEDSGERIQAARMAYNRLTDGQKRLVTNHDVLIAAELAYAKLTGKLPFTDVTGHWALEGIRYVYEKGLFEGVSETQFDPEGTMNRAMLVTALYRLEGGPAVHAQPSFTDVKDGLWYTNAIVWATENGIVDGYGDGCFGPMDEITREQMAAALWRYAAWKGYDVSGEKDLSAYADADEISAWAQEAMKWAGAVELVTGRTEDVLAPRGDAVRAEVATLLMRFLKSIAA